MGVMKKQTNPKSVTHKGDEYQIPFQITCNVSGLTKVYTSEDYINGKLDRFGGLVKLRATYVCRDALRLRKGGMDDAAIRAKLNPVVVPEPVVDITPETAAVTESAPEAPQSTEKPKAKKDKRGWYRDSKGHVIPKEKLGEYELIEEVA